MKEKEVMKQAEVRVILYETDTVFHCWLRRAWGPEHKESGQSQSLEAGKGQQKGFFLRALKRNTTLPIP